MGSQPSHKPPWAASPQLRKWLAVAAASTCGQGVSGLNYVNELKLFSVQSGKHSHYKPQTRRRVMAAALAARRGEAGGAVRQGRGGAAREGCIVEGLGCKVVCEGGRRVEGCKVVREGRHSEWGV